MNQMDRTNSLHSTDRPPRDSRNQLKLKRFPNSRANPRVSCEKPADEESGQIECASLSPMAAPLLFLDLDDVLCLNNPYSGRDLQLDSRPADLYQRLWSAPAVDALKQVLKEAKPLVVLTTTWLSFIDLAAARQLFGASGLVELADALHADGEAPQLWGKTRLDAINAWLQQHNWRSKYAILDDTESGTGLRRSLHDRAGRLVLCDAGVGFSEHLIPQLLKALTR